MGKAGARHPGLKALGLVPNAGHSQKQLCPKGLNRNDDGVAFQPKQIALMGYPIWVVPCGEAFSEQTTYFTSFKTVSQFQTVTRDED